MTQAPATPSLVERLRSYYPPICQEAADALEAQQARIAELEVERDDLQRMYRHWAMIADQRLGASNRSLHRARDLQALADRYEKALREISDLADECVVFDAENVAAVEAAPDKAAASPGFSVLRYWNERLKLSKSWKRRIDEIRDQALSSQGRHEGGEDVLPELPGVNAVPLPASPDGPRSDGTPMPADFVEEVRERLTMIADGEHLRGKTYRKLGSDLGRACDAADDGATLQSMQGRDI